MSATSTKSIFLGTIHVALQGSSSTCSAYERAMVDRTSVEAGTQSQAGSKLLTTRARGHPHLPCKDLRWDAPPRTVTCELSRVGCCLRRCQQQISTCRSQEGGKSLSRVENDPRRLSQKVCGKVVLRVRPIAGERRQHHSHCSYNTRTPQRMTAHQSHRPPPPPQTTLFGPPNLE